MKEFADALSELHQKIHYCKTCGNICEGEECEICKDPTRDHSMICVVEKPQDVYAMEKVKEYHGLYHVLHALFHHGWGWYRDLNIESLFDRIDDKLKEIIIATNPTRDGETTALYLARLLEDRSVNVTRIAHGLPIGSNIDYCGLTDFIEVIGRAHENLV